MPGFFSRLFRRSVRADAAPAPSSEQVTEATAIMDQQLVPGLTLRNFDAWARHFDGWTSTTTGIGTPGVDKRLTHKMTVPLITYQEAIDIYRADDIAKRAIEAPIEECFRQGYEITIADEGKHEDLKETIETKIRDLKLNHAIKKAIFTERAFGGSAILIGANDNQTLDKPLDMARITSIDWLTVLEPIELQPLSFYEDPEAAKYGEVEFYELSTFTTFSVASAAAGEGRQPPPNTRRIHESRLIIFGGVRVSRYQVSNNTTGAMWGDSKLTALVDVLRDFNVAWSAAGLLAVDFGQPVISVENLMLLVAKNPADFQARMRALEHGRSTARAILIDAKKEKFERQGTTLNGFPDLLNGLSMRLAAAVDMPLTLLMGQSPKGLGNEGDSDVRFYYDRIRGKQTTEIGPLIMFFVDMIIGTLKKRGAPKKVSITFNELWQMTDAEKAQARLTQARTDSMYIKSGVVFPNEIRMSRFRGAYSFDTQINEHKEAPGFVSPPPNGTPGSPHNPGPGGTGPNGHAVGGYTRRNPVSKGTEPATPEGGDKAPGTRKDAAQLRRDAISELEQTIQKLRAAARDGESPYVIELLKALAMLAAEEQADHDAGLCDPGCCLVGQHADGDGPGELVAFAGFPVIIESPKGSIRHWVDTDGTPGITTMRWDYGYIDGALGADGDCVDVYLGPQETAEWVYVIHQNKKPDFTTYDEDKVMIGWLSADAARDAYLKQYNDPRFFAGMSMMSSEVFRKKVFQEAGKVSNA